MLPSSLLPATPRGTVAGGPRDTGSAAPRGADRTWTLVSHDGPVDVVVHAPDEAVLADVLPGLGSALGHPSPQLWAGSTALTAGTPLSSSALCHGAVLGLDRPGPRSTPDRASGALEVQVTGGPDAGRGLALGQGTLVVGRASGCGLVLTDPDVSRRHAVVSVAGGRVSVADLGSANGTSVSGTTDPGTPLGTEGREWPVGATVHLGSTTLRLTGPCSAVLDSAPARGGRVGIRPLPLPVAVAEGTSVHWPVAPAEPARRRLGWIAVALPAVGGVLMAWLLATPHFLFFALLSPLVAVATWCSDRLSGRRTHRAALADHAAALARAATELDLAVAADLAAREDRHPDPARLAAAARRRASPLWSRSGDPARPMPVRLGTGDGPSSVTRVEPDGSRVPVAVRHAPVTLPLGGVGVLGVVGPRGPAVGVARSLVCQLATLHPPTELRLVLVCGSRELTDWRWARWLPHLSAVVTPATPLPSSLLAPPHADRPGPQTLVVLDGTPDPAVVAALAHAPEQVVRLDVAGSEVALALPTPARLQVSGETGTTGRLRAPGLEHERTLALDAVGEAVAERLARDLAVLAVPSSGGELPSSARLLELPGSGAAMDPATGAPRGSWHRGRGRLTAVLGLTGDGPLVVDLVGDGPHALVAGTTGSGKSELLQTLVAGLALHQPPDRCSFLLVDYKGGAAFGAAAALPHTVGLLTDLDSHSTARALHSLSAELTRRERLLAEHGVRDLVDLPATVDAGRLVIVVDEFATLAEELPGFVSGLVGIAQRGRSLGVHLVLATQRPAGVVSPEIRANCSLRICLRTTDESDARDVLGSTLPAQLSPGQPGRAYLRSGSTAPVLLQVARVSGGSPPTDAAPTVTRSTWPMPPAQPGAHATPAGEPDLQRVVAALGERARTERIPPPHRPWLPPLPDRLPADALDRWRTDRAASVLRIGLCDVPDHQRQTPLELDLAIGGGWAFVGGPRSGRTTALATVLAEAVAQLPPDALHVHVLDHGGGALAATAASGTHTGTAVGRDDPHRTVRLVARLLEEVDRRRAVGCAEAPALLVLVDGWESLAAQLEEAEPATGAGGLLRLIRDGAAARLTVALTTDRAVPGSRVASALHTRVVLPLPDRADYAVAGIAARSVPGHRPPGRSLVGEDAVECQLALPRPAGRTPAGSPAAAAGAGPLRVAELPADPRLDLPDADQLGPGDPLALPLGPGDDDGAAVSVDVQRSGGLLVVGPPGSGRSSALHALGRHALALGAAVAELLPGPGAGPAAATGQPERLDRVDPAALREWARRQDGRPALVLADEVTGLPDAVADQLSALSRPSGSVLVLGTGTAAELAGSFRGPTAALRRARTALVLRPGPGDAELLGLRLPRTPLPARPGSGWLVTPAGATRVQVARHRGSADAV
ncbi:FtsK/SpoIIIE domain-containing protein [uncultured Modestobacter sp.]|uniref:FtsK/SpoIIIE domain-containing protein n=1 Tax=uncultured Modestobacter sp. TaxID=380048 RepID=UPI0026126304|nr:FtsK/SpoIIIE domain-containing protein [uncultured Modestobacter sp.]